MPTFVLIPLVPRLCPLDLESALVPAKEKELLPAWTVAHGPLQVLQVLQVLQAGTREMLFALEGSWAAVNYIQHGLSN